MYVMFELIFIGIKLVSMSTVSVAVCYLYKFWPFLATFSLAFYKGCFRFILYAKKPTKPVTGNKKAPLPDHQPFEFHLHEYQLLMNKTKISIN